MMTPLIPVRLTCRFRLSDGNGETRLLEWLCKVSQNILQYMVNVAWKHDVKTREQLRKLVYKELRKLYSNVPAILIPTLYSKALGIVKSAKSNGGSRPTIKKPFTILHKQMYKLGLNLKNLALTVLDLKGNVLYQEKLPFKGLKSLSVSAKETSSRCPICNKKLKQKGYEEFACPKHGLMDRDLLASWNIAKKGLRMVNKMWGVMVPS